MRWPFVLQPDTLTGKLLFWMQKIRHTKRFEQQSVCNHSKHLQPAKLNF